LTYEESLGWSAHEWRKIAKYRNYFLGECDGVVAGMASGGHNDAYPGTGWLYSMYVSPKYRGSGLANQLVDAAATWARGEGAQHLYLHVTGSVQRARAFYAKVGFVENGEIIVMERDPSITLRTMVKPLD
jgi:GNAT superfamily N-acetyltransferase